MFKKRKLSPAVVKALVEDTGLTNLDRAVEKILETRDLANHEANNLADWLVAMQERVEIAQEDLDRRDAALQEHFCKLAEAAGLSSAAGMTEEIVLEQIRVLRRKADLVALFDDVRAGKFDPDAELLRRVACAAGTSTVGDVKSVLERVNTLASLPGKVAELLCRLTESEARIEELEGPVDEIVWEDDDDSVAW